MLRSIQDAIIRRKAGLKAAPFSRYSIRSAACADDYRRAFNLVQVCYSYLGIEEVGTKMYRMTDQHLLPETHVLMAWEGERVVGTISVTFDSPGGVPLDKDYRGQLEGLRAGPDHRIAEIGSFAVVQRCRHAGVSQMLAMAALRMIWRLGCTHTVIGIHPKATSIYRALWGFEPMAAPREHACLHAPVVALVTSRAAQRAHLRRHYGEHKTSRRSIESLIMGQAPMPNTRIDADTWAARSESNSSSVAPTSRQRMPRALFQELFSDQSEQLRQSGGKTLDYIRQVRSDETLGYVEPTPPRWGTSAIDSAHVTLDDGATESGLIWFQ